MLEFFFQFLRDHIFHLAGHCSSQGTPSTESICNWYPAVGTSWQSLSTILQVYQWHTGSSFCRGKPKRKLASAPVYFKEDCRFGTRQNRHRWSMAQPPHIVTKKLSNGMSHTLPEKQFSAPNGKFSFQNSLIEIVSLNVCIAGRSNTEGKA